MNQTQTDIICALVVDAALQFMAQKAGCSVSEVCAAIAADTEVKYAARYLAELVALGVNSVPQLAAQDGIAL